MESGCEPTKSKANSNFIGFSCLCKNNYKKKNSFCQLCGYEPENQPQIVYEENESTYNVSGDINSLIISMKKPALYWII